MDSLSLRFLGRLLSIAAIGLAGVNAQAQTTGDPEAGKDKAALCAACHGADGNSVVGEWPKLAGQHAKYTLRQIKLFKSQNRESLVMYPVISMVSDEDAADIAAYYSTQKVKPGTADESVVAVGESIYRGGNPANGVPACMACHGPSGRGNPGAGYPALGGQHAQYTGAILRRFQGGEIWGDAKEANAIMAAIAGRLSEDEIVALSSYIEGLY
ncbi:MAG: c-type cytochrome [Pseudomonadota bacterium]